MIPTLPLWSADLDYATNAEYREAILLDLARLDESLALNGDHGKIVIYMDYGVVSGALEIARAAGPGVPVSYRTLGVIAPKYQNQWREWPGCPTCKNRAHRKKTHDDRYQCLSCGLETTRAPSHAWTTLDRGDPISGRHRGKRVAILGGGPSLLTDIKRLPNETFLFAVNHHAPTLGVQCDYVTFNDEVVWDYLEAGKFPGTRISRFPGKNDIFLPLIPRGTLTGMTAVTIAKEMGFSEILLCGFDCTDEYRTPGYSGTSNIGAKNPSWHLKIWKVLKGTPNVFVMSGPLEAMFPLWDPASAQ